MGDTPEPRDTRRHDFDGLSSIQLANLPLFLQQWNGLSDEARRQWAAMFVWDIRHKREHEEADAQRVIDEAAAEKKKVDDAAKAKVEQDARDRRATRRNTLLIGIAGVVVTAGAAIGPHIGAQAQTAPAQKIFVVEPNGQLVPLPTVPPTPTSGVSEP